MADKYLWARRELIAQIERELEQLRLALTSAPESRTPVLRALIAQADLFVRRASETGPVEDGEP
jgi:hypothetical protein